jgi:hypothetical protein
MRPVRSGIYGSRNLAFGAAVTFVISIIVFIERGLIGFVFLAFAGAQAVLSWIRAGGGR